MRLVRRHVMRSLMLALGCCACAALIAAGAEPQATTPAKAAQPAKPPTYAIQIEPVASGAATLPPEFQMALYENMIREVGKTGRFTKILRSGDRTATDTPQLLVMHTSVEGFTQGSQRTRDVTTVAGATSIKVHVQVTAPDGKSLVDRNVEGKVRFFGDNLRATYDLSKAVCKILVETF